ncbi:IS1380 family transposase [Dermatophilaceae bacterium Soc4.6]
MQAFHTIDAVFDDPNLIGVAGLVPVMRLAERAGLQRLLTQRLTVSSPNAAVKAGCVVAGMIAGADSIDDLDVLRHGGMSKVVTGVRAPSTVGTFLRTFTFGHVRQLDAISSQVLAGLAGVVPRLLAGTDAMAFVDIDDTIREVHGYKKQGVAYGYSGVKGLNAQLAVLSSPTCAPVIAACRLRKGNTISGQGGAKLVGDAVATARRAGACGQVMVRADSGYYRRDLVTAALKAKAWFSVTVRMNPAVVRAIGAIPEDAWTTIKYPRAIWDDDEQRWISEAQVAETEFIAFTSARKDQQVPCRLVVRRVQRLNKVAVAAGQDELFASWRHHGFVTNSTLTAIAADETHRDHAIVEQVIAELKSGAMAHAPSGKFDANAAWLALACLAFNLLRAAGVAASTRHAKARWATLRTHLVAVPGRVASSARRLMLHLPTNWPWANAWDNLWATATATAT